MNKSPHNQDVPQSKQITPRAYKHTALTSASVKNHKYCLRLALAKSTGTHPPTSESKRDFRVILSPGGAGQYWARWKSIIWLEAFTTWVMYEKGIVFVSICSWVSILRK